MGFRFRKRIRIAKGLYLNLGRRSGSLSIGRRGATMNISEKGVHETVGLPGTGISYRTHRAKIMATRGPVKAPRHSVEPARFLAFIAVTVIVLWILAHLH